MTCVKISQWLSRAFERCHDNTSSADTAARSISAPFNVEILPQDGSMTSLSRDNPDQDVSNLRHTAGPGFQLMSDLHCERQLDATTHQYAIPDIPKRAPYLILAGDIGRLCDRGALKCMLRQLCSTFERVLLVPGNHEFYGTSRQEGLRIGEELSTELGDNFVLMNRRRVDLGGAVVLGCTLHSHIPEGSHPTNDFIRIQSWSVKDHNDEHRRDLSWLEKMLSEVAASRPDVRVIIVTHYAPTYQKICHPKHEKKHTSTLLLQRYAPKV